MNGRPTIRQQHSFTTRSVRSVKGIAASEAKMTAVDRLGFHLRLNTPQRIRSVRIGFPVESKTRPVMAPVVKVSVCAVSAVAQARQIRITVFIVGDMASRLPSRNLLISPDPCPGYMCLTFTL